MYKILIHDLNNLLVNSPETMAISLGELEEQGWRHLHTVQLRDGEIMTVHTNKSDPQVQKEFGKFE